jgi:RNA polymerase sigma-70 factor (ECF subfamily)
MLGFYVMEQSILLPHLFRIEFRKIVAVLSRLFGLAHIEIAEDITSETFLLAAETWGKKGIPENPTAWLYAVAKNKAKDYLKRDNLFSEKIAIQLKQEGSESSNMEIDITKEGIQDSELKMIFAICHPSISAEAQIGLALRILFGFGIDEIADAFLSNKETINKRLHRAKQKLREENIKMELPDKTEISLRLSTVYLTLYLLFNEGYYSASQNSVLRKDICLQALQLAYLLTEFETTNTPELNAVIALMCFHCSRFETRIRGNDIVLLEEQDTSKWDYSLIQTGELYLNKSATGDKLSKYHLEAAIAYWHTQKTNDTSKWENILKYYNLLLQIEYSPIAALNRTYALFKNYGADRAIDEAKKLNLENYYLYHALLGYFYQHTDKESAVYHLSKAKGMTKSEHEKRILDEKIENTQK